MSLENIFRLWVCGVPSLPTSQGYSVTLSCTAVSGSPAINLYLAETNGGTLYLTDSGEFNRTIQQTSEFYHQLGLSLGVIKLQTP